MISQHVLSFPGHGRGMIDLSSIVMNHTAESGIRTGLCNLFLHHTSASLILCENADPAVQQDLEAFMQRLVKDGDPLFQHVHEGPDDMPAHVRTVLTQSSLSVPITEGRLALGRWQGIYIWEHRLAAFERKVTLTLMGE